jgi:predicted transcriptional regulator of viral defense system
MMTRNIKYLSKTGNDLLSNLLIKDKSIFVYSDAAQIYGDQPGLRAMLSSLVKSGWLQRIEKGKYMVLPLEAGSSGQWSEHEFIIASYLIKPYYIGFQSALNYYGYTEKVSKTVYVVSTRRKLKPVVNISGVSYQLVNLDKSKFYGLNEVVISQKKIVMSDREKTIIDCLYLQEYCGGIATVAQALWYGREELDFPRLAGYAVKYGNKAVCQRLGYLMEALNIKKSKAIDTLYKKISGSYARLDILAPAQGKYLSKWKIQINISENDLLQWRFDR